MPVEKLLDNTSLLLRCVILGAGPCTLAASFSLTWPLAPLSSVQTLYTLAASDNSFSSQLNLTLVHYEHTV